MHTDSDNIYTDPSRFDPGRWMGANPSFDEEKSCSVLQRLARLFGDEVGFGSELSWKSREKKKKIVCH